jgi:hypothetical protein
LLFLIITLCGCTGQLNSSRQKVLLPGKEHSYSAELVELPGSYKSDGEQETIEISGLKLEVPTIWRYETMYSGQRIRFFIDQNRFFMLRFGGGNKNVKNFWSDLYLLTDQDIRGWPDAQQHIFLRHKRIRFLGATRLVHYKGKNLEAFQRNLGPQSYEYPYKHTEITIFPKTTDPYCFRVEALYYDDVFFANFLDMLNMLNP